MRSTSLRLAFLLLACFAGAQTNIDTQIKGSLWPAFGTDSGTATAYAVATHKPLGPSLRPGSEIKFLAAHTNTGASTLAVDGGSAIPIKKNVSVALLAGDIVIGQWTVVAYDGTNFQCITCGIASLSGGSLWSSLANPAGNLALSMGSNTTTFTYGATTGSGDLFTITDTLNNTGTGALLTISRASGSTTIPLRLKQLSNGTTQSLLQLENSSAAVSMEFHVNDIGGFGTNRIEAKGGSFMLTRGGTAASNTLFQFSDTGTSKWLGTITSNFDGVTSSEVGLAIKNIQTMSSTSTAAIASVQNNATRIFDVSPAETNVKSGRFIIATTQTPASSAATCTTGTVAWDASFIYICKASNSWVRATLATF